MQMFDRTAVVSALVVFALGLALVLPNYGYAKDVSQANWIDVAAGSSFTMRCPPGTKFRAEQGIDSFASGISGPGFSIEFDYGRYSPTLSDFISQPGVQSEPIEVDGKPASVAWGPAHDRWCNTWIVAMRTGPVSDGISDQPNTLFMEACARRIATIETIKTMFRSIRFRH
jgi:hypothetical protein